MCLGEKVWFQYNMAPAANAAAYGTRAVATDTNTVPANQTTAVLGGTFVAQNQFAPLALSTTPLGCRGVRNIQAGWLAATYSHGDRPPADAAANGWSRRTARRILR